MSGDGTETVRVTNVDPERFPLFWAKVEVTGACWLWTGCRNERGYGEFRLLGRTQKAHRVAYQFLVGPIGDGLDIDHLCRVTSCVNPDHLEPVTRRINNKRGRLSALRVMTPHCKNGHERTQKNTRIDRRGFSVCRDCNNASDRKYRARLQGRVAA